MPPSKYKNSPWDPYREIQDLPISLLTNSEIAAMDEIIKTEKEKIQAKWSPAREAQARGELLTIGKQSSKAIPYFTATDGRRFRCINSEKIEMTKQPATKWIEPQ